jgi:Flp pilus assembly protein TadG
MQTHLRLVVRFARSRRGNVAMMFALLLIPLLVAAGVAIDLLRASNARTSVAEAADAALLAAARAKLRNPSLTDAQALTIAQKNFAANTARLTGVNVTNFAFMHDQGGEVFRVTGDVAINTTLMQVVGRRTVNFRILSEAREASPRALEVVLVLDNTYSMAGQKMSDLKNAAGALIDTVMKNSGNTTKVGLAPFSRHVNVGVSRKLEPWLNIPPDGVWSENKCTVDASAAAAQGCTSTPATCYYDGAPYSCDNWSCPSGTPPQSCTTIDHPTTWFGCVGSRPSPLTVKDEGYTTNPIPGVLNVGGPDCPTEITPLTTSKGAITLALAKMDVTGETYVGAGLFWGQALISSDAPFTEGMSYAEMQAQEAIKAIVLMTDGENTASPDDWGGHYDNNVFEANTNTKDLCAEIKGKGVRIYTIAFDVTDAAIITLMRDCASDPTYFYEAKNSVQLSEAFDAIGSNLTELALTK